MDPRIWLLLSTTIFAAFLLFRLQPRASGDGQNASAVRQALREAQARIESATTPGERAKALADAGDACARSIARTTGAVGFYLRAMRSDPTSEELVRRAGLALVKRPHALESLMWRRLGAEDWTGERRAAAVASVQTLAGLYAGPLRNRSRARALEHALLAMGESLPARTPSLADS